MHRAALLVVCCAGLGAQPAAVEGVVVNQATGRPVAGVHVRFLSAAPGAEGQPYGAVSDLAGHFSIASLPAGTYIAEPKQRGFFYMPSKGGAPVRRVTLKSGQQLTGFKIEMVPGATISGRVTDDNGDPAQAGVFAEDESGRTYSGRVAYHRRAGRVSPERGAGQVLHRRATGPPRDQPGAGDPHRWHRRSDLRERLITPVRQARQKPCWWKRRRAPSLPAWTSTWRGSRAAATSPEWSQARRKGRAAPWCCSWEGDDPRRRNFRGGMGVGPDGHFQFTNLPPGTYRLLGSHQDDKAKLYSQPADVHLEGGDVTNVSLVLAPGGELTENWRWRAFRPKEKLSVGLETMGSGENPPAAQVDSNGVFRVAGILPGSYRVNVTPLPENAYLKSVRLDGVEAPDGELDLSRAAQGSSLKILVSPNGGQIEGKLLDKDGEPLGAMPAMVILAADPREIDLERSLKTTEDGTYRFQGIRPGKYRLLAFDADQFGWGPDSLEMVKKLAASAEEIEIKEGDRKVKGLKLLVKEDADAKPAQ